MSQSTENYIQASKKLCHTDCERLVGSGLVFKIFHLGKEDPCMDFCINGEYLSPVIKAIRVGLMATMKERERTLEFELKRLRNEINEMRKSSF